MARDRYAAQAKRDGVKYYLGVFDDPDQAHEAYKLFIEGEIMAVNGTRVRRTKEQMQLWKGYAAQIRKETVAQRERARVEVAAASVEAKAKLDAKKERIRKSAAKVLEKRTKELEREYEKELKAMEGAGKQAS